MVFRPHTHPSTGPDWPAEPRVGPRFCFGIASKIDPFLAGQPLGNTLSPGGGGGPSGDDPPFHPLESLCHNDKTLANFEIHFWLVSVHHETGTKLAWGLFCKVQAIYSETNFCNLGKWVRLGPNQIFRNDLLEINTFSKNRFWSFGGSACRILQVKFMKLFIIFMC